MSLSHNMHYQLRDEPPAAPTPLSARCLTARETVMHVMRNFVRNSGNLTGNRVDDHSWTR